MEVILLRTDRKRYTVQSYTRAICIQPPRFLIFLQAALF